ncbi:Actin-fragmin kinase [Thelohanellus kitauei]|uniref:Actin-fragmin kinase n=1 Tax=Thelohanellus kitauei TaxID=669202 RepID=A0A0C2MB70_THEKT|nr:Actin-fragmin kinase [Thelohanellus kitauei]
MNVNIFFYHNQSLYVVGRILDDDNSEDSNYSGEENSYVMYKFCLKYSKWSKVQESGVKPTFYDHAYGTIFENQLYIFYPESTETNKFREVFVFDFSTNVWNTKATKSKNQDYPDERTRESYAFSRYCAYMSGGSTDHMGSFYSDVWRIDLETLEWEKIDYFHETGVYDQLMSVVNDSYVYIVGGYDKNSHYLNTFERFAIRPPSLYRLCLESQLHKVVTCCYSG